MSGAKSHEDILRDANVRLCKLHTWSNYEGLGFCLNEGIRPPHLIDLVESNSPAAAGGLKIYDVLLAVNTEIVAEANYAHVIGILRAAQTASRPLELLVVEQRFYKILKKKNITIDSAFATTVTTPKQMPKDDIKLSKNTPRTCHIRLQAKETNFGFDVISKNKGAGVYVQEVMPGSPAYKAGLSKSDRIIEIDDKVFDNEPGHIIIDKLSRATARRTVKLLVVDTGTYRNSVVNNPDVDKGDAYLVDPTASDQRMVGSTVHRSHQNSDFSTLSPTSYDYISLDNDQQRNEMTLSQARKRNDNQASRALYCPFVQSRYLPSSRQKHSNSEHNDPYIEPSDLSNTTRSSTLRTSHFRGHVLSCAQQPAARTTKISLIENNDKSDYLEPSSIVLQINEGDRASKENGMRSVDFGSREKTVTNDDGSHRANQRFFDVHNEPLVMMLPIESYEETSLLPLDIAVKDLNGIIHKIERRAWIALERSAQPSDGLTRDESASIQLYTMKWTSGYPPLSMQMNAALRSEDQDLLRPYFPYFKLILTALWKLKSVNTVVWRGVKADVRRQYPVGQTFVWWGFSSCMESSDLLQSSKYLGTKGRRTLFNIQCTTGKFIRSHSFDKHENEILLLPATQFQVINHEQRSDDSYIIYLKEIPARYTLLHSPFDTDYSLLPSIMKETISEENSTSCPNQHLRELLHNHHVENSLCIQNQPISIRDMHLIATQLQSNEHWCKIALHQIELGDEHMMILVKALQMNVTVTSLHLSSNQLNDQTSALLARALETNVYLKYIDLSDNQLTEIGALSFSNMLTVNKTLLTLNLSSNNLGNNGMISIILALQHNNTLKTLYLNRTKQTDRSGQEMTLSIELNINLKGLYLNENNLGDGGTITTCRFLSQSRQLHTLHLVMNNITSIGAEKIGSLLQQTDTSLTELDVSENPLRDKGVTVIARALTRSTVLTELYLDAVEMTIRGLRELVKMICTNDTLKHLSLKKNDIDDDGMMLLSNGMQCNNVLTHLYLNMNALTDKCVSSMLNVLKNNNTLKYLCLLDNQLTEEGKLALNGSMDIRRTKCIC